MIHLLVHISPLYTADFILAPILNCHIRRLGNAIFIWLCRQNIILTWSVARMGGCFFAGRSVWCRPWFTHSGIWMAEIAAASAAGAHLITVVEGCGLSSEGEEKGSEWGDGSCNNWDVILDAGTRVSALLENLEWIKGNTYVSQMMKCDVRSELRISWRLREEGGWQTCVISVISEITHGNCFDDRCHTRTIS